MARLTLEEQELHINMTADNRNVFEVFTDDPVWIARLDKIATSYRSSETGRWYRLDARQVTLRKMRKPLTAEQKAKLAERLAENVRVA